MHELAEAVHDLHLVRLQVPDEVPAEGVAVARVLALEILRSVLAHHLDTGLCEGAQVVRGDVLRRDDDRDVRADLLAYARVALRDRACGRDAHAGATAATSSRAASSSASRPVELAVELAPADLGEDLPHSGRLGETELDEIRAADLEAHVAKPCEVLAQLGTVVAGEREQRRVRCERVGERDDLSRVEPISAQALDDARRDRDRADDALHVAPAHLQPLEPVVRLVGREVRRQRRDPDAPCGHADTELVADLDRPREELRGVLVTAQVRMDGAVGAELAEPSDALRRSRVLEQRHELVAQSRGRKVADEPHLDASPQQAAPSARRIGARTEPRSGCRGRSSSGRR